MEGLTKLNESIRVIPKLTNTKKYGIVVSSRDVAKEIGKPHKHVLEVLDSIYNRLKIDDSHNCGFPFILHEYSVSGNFKKYKEYLLTKEGFLLYIFNIQGYINFKMSYIKKFDEMEQILRNRSNSDWLITRKDGKLIRRLETDAIQELVPYAIEQGSKNSGMLYTNYSKLVNNLVGIEANSRDKANYKTLINIRNLEDLFTNIMREAMENKIYYKEIYKICKARGQELINLLNYNGNLLKIS